MLKAYRRPSHIYLPKKSEGLAPCYSGSPNPEFNIFWIYNPNGKKIILFCLGRIYT